MSELPFFVCDKSKDKQNKGQMRDNKDQWFAAA